MIQVENVTKRFNSFTAVQDVSFHVEPGEVVGLLGPNGAGKTTLFRLIAGLIHPDEGRVELSGPARHSVGYKPERLLFPNQLRVDEYLRLVAGVSDVDRARRGTVVAQALQRVGLAGAARKHIRDCSKGMRQRLGMAQVMVGDPHLILLDEPSNGLDPEGQADMCRLIAGLHGEGRTILISSHQLGEVRQVCTRIVILNRGSIHYQASMAEALAVRPHITIEAAGDLVQLCDRLSALHPELEVEGAQVVLRGEAVGLRREVLRLILDAGLDVCRVEQRRTTLEEIYAEVVR